MLGEGNQLTFELFFADILWHFVLLHSESSRMKDSSSHRTSPL